MEFFSGCLGLRIITCYAVNPPAATETTFAGVSQYTKTYVLNSSLEEYQSAIGWRNLNLLPISDPTDLLTLPYEGKDGIGYYKFIQNGQLYILRDGKTYTAQGMLIE